MLSTEECIENISGSEFHIEHPYADFTFKTGDPVMCGGGLHISVWNLRGKISIDGNKWFDINTLTTESGYYTYYHHECLVNNYGWVYFDIYTVLNEIVSDSSLKSLKIISLSNKSKPTTPIYSCQDISKMNREVLVTLDKVKTELVTNGFDVSGVSTDEEIITINLNMGGLPSINLREDELSPTYQKVLLKTENDISQILSKIGITRFTLGKINIR